MTDKKKAYYAGVLDARAIFASEKGVPILYVKMRGKLPKKLLRKFGGSIMTQGSSHRWRLYGRATAKLLEKVLPHMSVRRRDAEYLLQSWRKRSAG